MNKAVRLLAMALCCLLFAACAAPVATPMVNPAQTDERLLSDVRTQYRNASLIVEGVCTGSHVDSSGSACYDLSIAEVYAGSVEEEYIVHCRNYPMNEGARYMLFLGEGEDVHYAEDDRGFQLLSDAPLPIEENEVVWNGRRMTVDALRGEIAQLGEVISAPAPVLYYSELKPLAEAADEIFIGHVVDLPESKAYSYVMRDGGAMEKAQYETSIATVEVYGSIKGAISQYGQRIELVHSPERVGSMLDAKSLQSTSYKLSNLPELEKGGVYLFFLKSGPDSKQQYYFPINPLQGFVSVMDDALSVSAANAPLSGYTNLTEVVSALHKVLDWKQAGDNDAPLLIIEE